VAVPCVKQAFILFAYGLLTSDRESSEGEKILYSI
jgi:hypothetical protein